MERAYQNNDLTQNQISLNDYPSDYLASPKRSKLWGIKSDRSPTHHDYFYSATPPCIALTYDVDQNSSSTSHEKHREAVREKHHNSSSSSSSSRTARRPVTSTNRKKKSDSSYAAIRNTSAEISREIINAYQKYAKHTASEESRGYAAAARNKRDAVAISGSDRAAVTRSCDVVCHGGTCRVVPRSGSNVRRRDDGFKCKPLVEDSHADRTSGHLPHASLTFDMDPHGTSNMGTGSTHGSHRRRYGRADDEFEDEMSSYQTHRPFIAWADNDHHRADNGHHQADNGESNVVCVGGHCHLKSRSPRYSSPNLDNANVDRDHHHRRASSRSWSRDEDDPWPSAGGSRVERSHSSSSWSRPRHIDDDNWTVLADLSHRGGDDYPDRNSTEDHEDHTSVRFSDGSYADDCRRHGWRFEVPGDPYCLKRRHMAERPTFYSPSNPSESAAEPRLMGHHWVRTDTHWHNTRPPRRPREYTIHPELASEHLCPIVESAPKDLERTKKRHMEAAKMMRNRF